MIKEIYKELFEKKHFVILIIFLIIYSEIFLQFNAVVGFVLYSFLIAMCLLSLSHHKYLNNYSKLIIVLMIVPIVRLTELFLSLDFLWKLVVSYSILLFLSFYYSVRFKLDHGHKKGSLAFMPIAIIFGIAIGFAGKYFFSFQMPSWIIFFIPVITYSEEILFRGMLQNLMKEGYGASFAVIISTGLYAIFSLSYGIVFAGFIFLAGLFIGIVYNYSKNIFGATLMNFLMHLGLFQGWMLGVWLGW